MGELFKQTQFIFNSTGQMESTSKPFQLFSDENGTILNKNHIEYGMYNKIINFEFKKVLMLKKHSIGLGDIVDWITKVTKIKNVIMYITKGNCGCEKRRLLFNKWIKFYWFSIKFREIYASDFNFVKNQKIFLKDIIPIKAGESSFVNNIPNRPIPRLVNYQLTQPPEPPIKKSCGCGAKS